MAGWPSASFRRWLDRLRGKPVVWSDERYCPALDAIEARESALASLPDDELSRALERLSERTQRPAPPPEQFGWIPIVHDEQGRAIRWYLPRYQALIGYVPGCPERTFLDVDHEMRAWDDLGIEELALGIEMGTLPDPDVVVDWRGDPIE